LGHDLTAVDGLVSLRLHPTALDLFTPSLMVAMLHTRSGAAGDRHLSGRTTVRQAATARCRRSAVATSRGLAPRANSPRSSRSIDTVPSAASIFATRD